MLQGPPASRSLHPKRDLGGLAWRPRTYLESQWPTIMGYFWIYYGLLWGIVACYFGLLGVPGSCQHHVQVQEML